MRPFTIGIVGGGPGGLMSAYFLEKYANVPLRITLFEATDRLGGKIITPHFDSVPVPYEAGAAEFYDYEQFDEDPLKDLIRELGLSISPMGGTAVIMDDQIITNMDDVATHLGTDVAAQVLEFDRKARGLQTEHEFYHSDNPEGFPGSPETESFRDLIDEMPSPAARKFVETLIHSDLATEPALTNLPYGLQNYLMNDPGYMHLYGIQGGNEQLPQELAKRISADVKFHSKVQQVEKHEDQLRVTYQDAESNEQRTDFDFVIIALPHNQIPKVTFAGEQLAEATHQHHEHFNYPAHYLRMTLLFETQFWKPTLRDSYWMLDAFEGCCLYDESSRQPGLRHGILGWLLGGQMAEDMCDWSDEQLVDAALDSLPGFLAHGREQFIEGQVQRWPCAVNGMPGGNVPWNLERRLQPEPTNHSNLFFVGDYMFDSTLNGVIDSAGYVAEWIAAQTTNDSSKQQSVQASKDNALSLEASS